MLQIGLEEGQHKMSNSTNIIYNKETGRILLLQSGKEWVLPTGYDVAQFKNGVEPVLINDENGNVYLKRNTIIVTDY